MYHNHQRGLTSLIKGTEGIEMREIDPSHVKETSFTCLLVIN